MANVTSIAIDTLRQLLRYDPETNKLFWRARGIEYFSDGKQSKEHNAAIWNGKYADCEAFTAHSGNGYLEGRIFNKKFRAHRVVWALHYGEWPSKHIDHINGDGLNNRISNLRDVSASNNLKNQKLSVRNTSGVIGIQWIERLGKWVASIRYEGRQIHLGVFANKEDAKQARKAAESKYGFHENHGRIK